MMIVVRFFPNCLMLFIMSVSVIESRDEVGSSQRIMSASFMIARAIATLLSKTVRLIDGATNGARKLASLTVFRLPRA